jgi:cholesterol transport system auxiliary component
MKPIPAIKPLAACLLLMLSACATINQEPPRTYVLSAGHWDNPAPRKPPARGLLLLVSPTKAWPGYDTVRIAYVKEPLRLDYYAKNEWADRPSRMLEPLLIKALEASGQFGAVVSAANGVPVDLRLDTEIIHLHQTFLTQPSQGRLALRAQLIDVSHDRILGTQTFEAAVPAVSDDPYGGVKALNQAVDQILGDIMTFCIQHTTKVYSS